MSCSWNKECTEPGAIINYTVTASDMDMNLLDLYNLQTSGYAKGDAINSTSKAPCDIPAGFDGIMNLLPIDVSKLFNISSSRLCNYKYKISPTPTGLSPTLISGIEVTVKLTDANLQSPPLQNDYLPTGILAGWISDWLMNYNATTNPGNPPTKIPNKFLNSEYAYLYNPPSIANFTSEIYNKSQQLIPNIEKYSGVIVKLDSSYKSSTRKFASPVLIGDYIFMYAYFFAFVGAIFYAINSIISIEPITIIANKNISVALNAFIGICGYISICIWYNIYIPFIPSTILNVNVIRTIMK